jgi:quercetin dioxygenase-like cupin family protein
MSVPEVSHFFSSGVYAKQMFLPETHIAKTHKHNYDHLSILAQGEVELDCNGVKTLFTAPSCIEIKAGIEHSIYAFKDSTFFCIHATDETENVDEVLIEKE